MQAHTTKPKQGSWANKAGGLTMQAGQAIEVPALSANVFAAATNRTNN